MKKLLLFSVALLGLSVQARAQLVINEIMQSNIDCIMDDINEFPDSWVELYNTGTSAENLSQYSIGLENDADAAWTLPSYTVPANGYVVIYCDKEATGMHADFRIDSGKGALYLFKNGAVADKFDKIKKQPAPNIAYGRKTDGASELGYQLKPTPEETNCGTLAETVLGDPVFSQKGRVFTTNQTITLTLSLPDDAPEGTQIRYSLDGSEPTERSPKYTNPLTFNSTRVVRAKLFCSGCISPRSKTESYIFHGRAQDMIVISIVTDNKYLNDNRIGILVEGTYQSGKKNYEFDWRRPINIEMFENSGEESFINQLCETRVQGGATRSNKMKSLAVYANKRFGTKRLEHEFFPTQKPGLTEFKSLVLRNSGNDFDYLYMRDAVIQRSMALRQDLDWQAWRPAIVYINGKYDGMRNIRERSNEDNIYTNYDGLEDIDLLENWTELKEGTMDNWNAFAAFYNEHGHTMAEYAERMDCIEFINLMAMNLYYNNQDFPGNNIVAWRPRAEGGKWRWIAKDTDFGLGLYGSSPTYNTIEWLYNNAYDPDRSWGNTYAATRLFRRLMEDADFKREFIDRCAIYMGDFMNYAGTHEVWDPMYEMIKNEYPHHRKLINEWWPDYQQEMNSINNWLNQRTGSFYTQLKNYYNLGTLIDMKVNNSVDDDVLQDVPFYFNGVKLTKGVFDGKFFQNRSVTLEGMAANGKKVTGWTVEKTVSGNTTTTQVDGSQYSFTMPSCTMLKINAITGVDTGINDVEHDVWTWTYADGSLSVKGVQPGMRVSLYDLSGILVDQQTAAGTSLNIAAPANRVYVLKVGDEAGVKLFVE